MISKLFRLFLIPSLLALICLVSQAQNGSGPWFLTSVNFCSNGLDTGATAEAVAKQQIACFQATSGGETTVFKGCTTSAPRVDGYGASTCSYDIYCGDLLCEPGAVVDIQHCPSNSIYDTKPNATDSLGVLCWRFGDRTHNRPNTCSNPSVGDPIYPLTGSRRQDLDLGLSIGGQPVRLTYDTAAQVPEANGGLTWLVPSPPSFGAMWQSNLHKNLVFQGLNAAGGAYTSVALQRGGSVWETASVAGYDTCAGSGGGSSSNAYTPTTNVNEILHLTGNGSAGSLLDGAGLTEESYDASGKVTTVSQAGGGSLSFAYTSDLLTSVTDQFGRAVQFSYEQPSDASLPKRINRIVAPDGSIIQATYDGSNNLNKIIWADNNAKTLVHENSSLPWALTGIVDENNARYGTYGYDTQGRANSTFLGAGAEKYSVSYGSPPAWSVVETRANGFICRDHSWRAPAGTQLVTPNGQVNNMTAAVADGMASLSGQTQPAGSGCSASSNAQSYDAKGNVTNYDDFNGNRTCYSYDTTRNLRTVTLKGLPTSKACPTALSSYAPSPVDAAHPERKTTTAWHPDWVLKASEAEPKKITTWVYNGQADPIGGGTAACAPSTATLPDGKPIAVLCARYEQATSDTTGALGLSATVNGAAQKWSFTYNQYGQVLTQTSPKLSSTDTLSHTTTSAYYTDTSFSGAAGHTAGDLQAVTNSLGQVTTYTSYDKAGRLLSSTDANGTVTTETYWPRGWLHSQTVTPVAGASLTTTYDYWPTGLLKTVTMPDTSALSYAYDDAHRLTDVTDGAGNKVHYVLDNVGNRTSEQISDASGNLASAVARVFDALNRVQAVTGAVH